MSLKDNSKQYSLYTISKNNLPKFSLRSLRHLVGSAKVVFKGSTSQTEGGLR